MPQPEVCSRRNQAEAHSDTAAQADVSSPFSVHKVVQCFERAVLTLHAYPRVWMAYFEFLQEHPKTIITSAPMTTTSLRRTVNSALQPVAVA
jgi:hypothetical protein